MRVFMMPRLRRRVVNNADECCIAELALNQPTSLGQLFTLACCATLHAGLRIGTTMEEIERAMKEKEEDPRKRVSLLNRYVQSLCGLYSRIARQLNVDRSYVSRVARGERRSQEIEQALSSEFTRIMDENERRTAS
jgi:hypothetical protein